jgi:Spy/CpxP family protein refolding chaperone
MKRYLLSAMLMLGAAAPAFAQPATLSPEIRDTVKDTHARFKGEMKPLWQDARDARAALKSEIQKAQPNEAELARLEDRIGDDRSKMQSLRAEMNKELRSKLGPKQYAELMLARQERFGRRMHRLRGGEQ